MDIPVMAETAEGRQADIDRAYHVIYNHKDKVPAGSLAAVAAFDALAAIEKLAKMLGYTVPRRFDADQ